MINQNISEDQLDVMHIIQGDSNATQRQIAQKTGLSIGKVNYCLKELINIGFVIKLCIYPNSKRNKRKSSYN